MDKILLKKIKDLGQETGSNVFYRDNWDISEYVELPLFEQIQNVKSAIANADFQGADSLITWHIGSFSDMEIKIINKNCSEASECFREAFEQGLYDTVFAEIEALKK